jgi:ankyrin repeat protein
LSALSAARSVLYRENMSSPFLKLIQQGARAEVADAVQADPSLAASRDPQGVSALIWSIYCGQTLVRDFLLARLATASIALDVFESAAAGDQAQLEALLAADPELAHAFSGDGWTPLHLAAAFGSAAEVAVLLRARAPVDAVSQNPQRNQPLHAALALGRNAAAVELLLRHGAPVNAVQAGGFTPLFSAASAGRRDLAELLLAHGANPLHKSDGGKTAAEFARDRGHLELAVWLESEAAR